MSKRRHNFGTKRFKEKSLFIFHAHIALKLLILLFVRLIARGARIGKTHTQTHRQTHKQNKYCNPHACALRVNYLSPSHVTRSYSLRSIVDNISQIPPHNPQNSQIMPCIISPHLACIKVVYYKVYKLCCTQSIISEPISSIIMIG